MSNNLDKRDYSELTKAISLTQHTVYKRYLPELNLYPLVEPTAILLDETAETCVRFFQLEELTCKHGEDVLQKLSTVYYASMSLGCSLIVLIDVEKINAPAKIYIGVRNDGADQEARNNLGISFRTLKNGMKSNFPGTKINDVPAQTEMPKLIDEIFSNETKYVSSVSCVASSRDKSKTENKSFIQGIERFIDAMQGNTYSALLIAEPYSISEQVAIRNGYESLYSLLSPFEKSIWSYNENESNAVMESLSKGISKSVTNGTSNTQAHTKNVGMNIGINSSKFSSMTDSHTNSNPTSMARAGQAMSGIAGAFGLVGTVTTAINPLVGGALLAANGILSTVGSVMQGSTVADTIANTAGKAIGIGGGLNVGYAKTTSDTTLHNETDTTSENKVSGTTDTKGTGRTVQIENINKSIEQILKHIEAQLKRIQEIEDYGAYNCAAYFLSGRQESCLLAAHVYRALMIGESSSLESGAINFWSEKKDPDKMKAIKEYLKRFVHPIFAMPISETTDDFITYTPGTTVSGLELPLHLGIPMNSVYGIPVIEHAEFGRNVMRETNNSQEETIAIGKIYHMGQCEQSDVELDINSLTSHVFVTGSTGTGKSNAIYHLIRKLNSKGVHYLVIEPAKGEYKKVFGNNCKVYGTNITKTELLRTNPFSFPDGIHVLEHIDRLVEIFNACWPMYAAMPAVLKDAIEKSYEKVGWNLRDSICTPIAFPTFSDLMEILPEIMNSSLYSDDTKSDYSGALITRVQSLTNGINGQIFCSRHEITYEELFENDVIIDLSRVGSSETKALLMGILVMKLQEYRLHLEKMNESLIHVTVLEEAHNLLRKTSITQSQEGANLQGKAVEMLTNSIAEMRTYGEGFIIADQAPELLDEAVIRNTNTKIVLRLPDKSDRELVGSSMALTDDQIVELAKLPKGVAAVYQNDWIESVLCYFEKFEEMNPLHYEYKNHSDVIVHFMNRVFGIKDLHEVSEEDADVIKDWIQNLHNSSETKDILFSVLEGNELPEERKRMVAYNVFEGKKIAGFLYKENDANIGIEKVNDRIRSYFGINDTVLIENIRQFIMQTIFQLQPEGELTQRYQFIEEKRRMK